jgi:hypothetical protein
MSCIIGLEWADIVGDIEYVMSETKEGQEVSRNPSLLKIGALKVRRNILVYLICYNIKSVRSFILFSKIHTQKRRNIL